MKSLDKNSQRLRTDRGDEYESSILNTNCDMLEIIHNVTPPYSPKSNGVIKRKNRTLNKMVNTLLTNSRAPLKFVGRSYAICLPCLKYNTL